MDIPSQYILITERDIEAERQMRLTQSMRSSSSVAISSQAAVTCQHAADIYSSGEQGLCSEGAASTDVAGANRAEQELWAVARGCSIHMCNEASDGRCTEEDDAGEDDAGEHEQSRNKWHASTG